jgi:transcriptional regulator with XRE-family HTH domain
MKGTELKQWRTEKGWSKSELARQLKVSRITIISNEAANEITVRLSGQIAEFRRTKGLAKIQEGLADMLPLTPEND